MAVRSEREKSKMQEKYQIILAQMLKEEDNKYCVDCDTKSPRWASWNIGVFICIRCAGFHRNLGVHISKVKSVNLDSWTGEQIASVQAMGNSRARAVYEANLPDGFRRPQADSALESFIRAKYEQRKWIAKEWIPPEITVPIDLIESECNQRRIETTSENERGEKNIPKLKPFAAPKSTNNPVRQTAPVSPPPPLTTTTNTTSAVSENNTQDLLDLDEPSITPSNNLQSPTTKPSSDVLDPLHEVFTSLNSSEENSGINQELANAFSSSNDHSTNNGGMMSNEKIMALFNTTQTSLANNSTMNIRPATNQTTNFALHGFVYPPTQQTHLLPHQKSVSYGNNLYQQANNIGSQFQQSFTSIPHSGMTHPNPNNMSAPILQSPTLTYTPEQLNHQFSHLMFSTNSKSPSSPSTYLPQMSMHSLAESIPTSSDSFWQ